MKINNKKDKNHSLATKFTLIVACIVLIGSFVSQYVYGLQPCALCLYQRNLWIVVLLFSLVLLAYRPVWPILIFLFVMIAAVSGYQVGVENKLFEVPSFCKASGLSVTSVKELTDQIMNNTEVSCGRPQFTLFGISFAGFDAMLSAFMALFIGWLFLCKRRHGK